MPDVALAIMMLFEFAHLLLLITIDLTPPIRMFRLSDAWKEMQDFMSYENLPQPEELEWRNQPLRFTLRHQQLVCVCAFICMCVCVYLYVCVCVCVCVCV